jgi:hypothetical protein
MIRNSFLVLAGGVLLTTVALRADITLSIDPNYPSTPALFTLDPEPLTVAQRGIAGTRQLRQTFQLSQSLSVSDITLSLALNGTDGGLLLSFYQVDDVNAASWTAGSLVKTLTIGTNVDLPSTTARLGLTLTGGDIFTLPQRDSGTAGYGIEIANVDGVSTVGNIRHSNNGSDNFLNGKYYTETGAQSGTGNRDFGVALVGTSAIPEPGTLALAGLGAMLVFRLRRRVR